MDPMKDLFLADTHLLDPCDEPYLRLLDFLDGQCGSLRSLVMLGDISNCGWDIAIPYFQLIVPPLERWGTCIGQFV